MQRCLRLLVCYSLCAFTYVCVVYSAKGILLSGGLDYCFRYLYLIGIPVLYSFDYILHVCFQWGMPRGVISYEQKMHAEQKQQIKADMPKVF